MANESGNLDLVKLHFQMGLCCVYAAFMLRDCAYAALASFRIFDEMNMFNFPASACSNFIITSRVQPVASHRHIPYMSRRDSPVFSRLVI
jgi:hypothetical protein